MPDLLSHYALSLLISSRVSKFRHALLFALFGLLPDVDVFFRIHRWFTHSLILLSSVSLITLLGVTRFRRELRIYVLLALILYSLHLILDFLTAPTPIFWPIMSESYALKVSVNGSISADGVILTPIMEVRTVATDFTPRTSLEGQLISEVGIITAVAVTAFLITEALLGKYGRCRKPPS